MSNFRSLLFSLFCAVIAALIGLGLSVRTPIVPGAAGEPAEGLYADGWLAQESEIDLGDFTPFLTLLEFSFNPWRPGGPAELHFHLCGEEIGKVLVTSDEPVRVRYSTYCKNAELTIKAANPFVPSESDPRLLAAQIKYVKVASPVGLPLVNPLIVLAVSIPIFLIQSMLGILFPALLRPAFYLAFSLGAVLVLSSTFDLNLSPLFPMTGFLALCAAGVLLASRLPPFSRIETGRSDNRESNVYTAAAMAVTAGALALRLYEIGFGLPLNYHPDEVPKVNAVMRMYSSGTLNPEYFLHPSLLLYSTYAMNLLLQLFLPDTQFQDSLNLAGRMVSVISGTLSVYLVYLIGRTIFSNLSGILGAVFLAAAPLHVTCSRYLKEDALLVFMILWATYLVVKSVEEDRPRLLLLAGLVAGLSASSKYSGLLTAAAVAAAPWLRSKSLLPDRAWIKPALLALLLFPVGFIAASPYSIIDITTFIEDFSYEKRHMEKGHASVIDAWSQYWTYYYSRVLGPGIGWPVLAVGTLMFGVAAWARAPKLLFVAGAVLLFYLPAEWIKAKPAPQPDRYVLPCLPFIALLAGDFFRRYLQVRKGFAIALLVFTVAVPLYRTVMLASELEPDTRERMREWIIGNLPAGSKILIDWRLYSPEPPGELFEVRYIERSRILEELRPGRLRASGYDYLIISSLFYTRYTKDPNFGVPGRAIIRELFRSMPIAAEFSAQHGTYGFHNPTLTLFDLRSKAHEER